MYIKYSLKLKLLSSWIISKTKLRVEIYCFYEENEKNEKNEMQIYFFT